MGIYLNLKINPERIEETEWEEVYAESLLLLRDYPFVRLKLQQAQGLPRLVYSSQVEEKGLDGVSRSWLVCGDAQSKKTAEEFSLERDLKHYYSRARFNASVRANSSSGCDDKEKKVRDILLAESDTEDDENGGGKTHWVSIFCNKTQGYDYHNYVLAIAMLIESRFQEAAMVSGDINLRQAEEAREWANQRLPHPISLPVRVDAERLWQRLEHYYQGEKLLKAFDRLYIRDSSFDTPAIFFEKIPSEDVKDWFRKQLFEYNFLTQTGAKKLMIGWLNNSKDLEALCEMVLTREQIEPHFPREDFIKALASTWAIIDPKQYEFFRFFDSLHGQSTSVNSQFGNMYLDSFFAGRHMAVHWDKEKVVPLLMRHTGFTAEKIEKLIVEENEQQVEKIMNFRKIFQSIMEQIGSVQSEEELMDDESVLLHYSKTTKLKEALKSELLSVTQQAMSLLREKEGSFTEASVEKIHEEIVLWIFHYRLPLTEEGWQWIDAERDPEVLRVVLTFLRIKDSSDRFYRIRQAVLENCLLSHSLATWLRES